MMKKLSKPIQSMSIISCFFLLHHGDFNAGPPPPPHYARNIAFFMDVQTSCRWRNEFNTKLFRPMPGLLFKWYFRKERHKKKAFEYKSEYKFWVSSTYKGNIYCDCSLPLESGPRNLIISIPTDTENFSEGPKLRGHYWDH